ncbi:MAG: RidA family protein [Deltaproteobacteria bacterium]|jgi:2-iminobutanoate/2-iminopropanoate deaminase|nr:RidA family protein [Deltaproteobacteria bacterium]
MSTIIATANAPAAIGPYVQARVAGGFVFVSGQLGMNPDGVLPADFETQAHNSLRNLRAILEEAGSSLPKVVKATVFLGDLENFAKLNAIYAEYFKAPCPARSCVEVARLPRDAQVEIEVIAER